MNLSNLDSEDKLHLVELLQEKQQRIKYNFIDTVFPASGDLSRDKYEKHLAFFDAGRNYRERAFISGNRSGKTFSACFETTLHLTGLYPDWWTGKKFDYPISACINLTNLVHISGVYFFLLIIYSFLLGINRIQGQSTQAHISLRLCP